MEGTDEVLGEKYFSLPLRPPQIPRGLAWDRSRPSAIPTTNRLIHNSAECRWIRPILNLE